MPNLFEPQTAKEIIDRLNNLKPDSQRLWGKMDVAQMLKHCNDALGTATGDVSIKTSLMYKLMSPIIKKMVMEKKPYKQGLPTAKEFIITSQHNFDKEKDAVLQRIQKFLNNGAQKVEGLKHPAFGKMTAEEWGYSQWKHFDHHLKQFGV